MAGHFAITSVTVDLPIIGPNALKFSTGGSYGNNTTVLIGRNGTGKSSILREITMSFRNYFSPKRLKSRQGMGRVSQVEINCDGQEAVLNVRSDTKTFRSERDSFLALRPTRLIALSFTPFDKFPPVDDIRERDGLDDSKPFYVYLGFKSDVRMSPRTRLLRSVDRLAFTSRTSGGDERVVRTLAAIGYGPHVSIGYDLVPDFARRASAELVSSLQRYVPDDRGQLNLQRTVLRCSIDFLNGGRFWTQSDGAGNDPRPIDQDVGFLISEGLVRVSSIVLDSRDSGEPVEILELSSGELNLLSGFLGLASFLEDGCVVLIDEPENSLHPEWQLRYVEMLEAVASQHVGCHFVIATHSPLIVSGVANHNAKILRLDHKEVELSPGVVADSSPDATLLNAFQVVTAGNNFLKQLVLEALSLIETGKHKEYRAQELAGFLSSIWTSIPEEDPLRNLVRDVVVAIQPQ